MKQGAVVLIAAVLFVFTLTAVIFADDIAWDDIGRGNLNLRTILINPDDPRIIYAGSNNTVLKSENGAESWKSVLSIKGQNSAVNFLLFGPRDKNFLYATTSNGLFYSANQGRDWKKIFRGKNYLENESTALAVLPYGIYLGTKGGLFVSKDQGRSWHKETARLGSSQILAIAYNPKQANYIYIACLDGVFRSEDSGESWEKIFIASPEEFDDSEEPVEDQDEEGRFSNLRYITIDPNNVNCLYLATSRGVYISQDKGQNWEPLTNYGLLNRDVRFLLVSCESQLYAVTKSGIFEYKSGRWQELSFRLAGGDIKSLALDNRNILYAACDSGLFKAKIETIGADGADNSVLFYYKNEPRINEVQQAAIKYAEVEPEKIMRWRKQARMRAFLPRLTVGLDRSERTNYEIYTSATTKYIYEGPHDKSNGWDITLGWELGDLIFNDDQTSIDVRSKLMVQLRDDILDEVTKIYFERLRLKMELDNLSIEDTKRRLEKELRLRELTAMLDGLTGGYFSSNKNG